MTREEAIKKLKNLVPKNCKMVDGRLKGGFPDWNSEEGKALEMAIADMEKQIPKKVIFEADGEELLCPSCGFDFMGAFCEPDHDPYYCFECGQALDWSEEE